MILKTGNLSEYRILVTGAAGFLGRRLIKRLAQNGARVIGLDRSHFPDVSACLELHENYSHRQGGLESPDLLNSALSEVTSGMKEKVALFHLAGASHAGLCESDPDMAFKANVIRTQQALEACRRAGLKRILFPSTALVYGENSREMISEDNPAMPVSFYAGTKLAAEAIISGYAGSYGFSCDIARISNVYGPVMNSDTAVGTALNQALAGGPIKLRTHKPVRDFVYCEDVIEGLIRLLLAGNEKGSRIFNLSTGCAVSVGYMAGVVAKIASLGLDKVLKPSEGDIRESKLVLDNNLLKKRTGWQPQFTIETGIEAAWREIIEKKT